MGVLTIGGDLDDMPQESDFHEGLHCLQGQNALEDWNTAYYVIPANDP